jgi:hypothetical protein
LVAIGRFPLGSFCSGVGRSRPYRFYESDFGGVLLRGRHVVLGRDMPGRTEDHIDDIDPARPNAPSRAGTPVPLVQGAGSRQQQRPGDAQASERYQRCNLRLRTGEFHRNIYRQCGKHSHLLDT